MRLRPVVLPVAVACAAAVAVPSQAQAGTEQCSLVMPTKVVVDAEIVTSSLRLATNCTHNAADTASWDLRNSAGSIASIAFYPEDFADGLTYGYMEWYDTDAMGRYVSQPAGAAQAGGAALTQNSPATLVKYASKLATKVTRTKTGLSWAVTASQWSGRINAWNTRARVKVGLFHRATGSTTWKYVKAVTTTSKGKATVALKSPKAGYYRLVVGETPTVWASYSTSIRGRV